MSELYDRSLDTVTEVQMVISGSAAQIYLIEKELGLDNYSFRLDNFFIIDKYTESISQLEDIYISTFGCSSDILEYKYLKVSESDVCKEVSTLLTFKVLGNYPKAWVDTLLSVYNGINFHTNYTTIKNDNYSA
jgi:hypothetical protein